MTTFCLVTDAKTSDSALQGSKYINSSLVFAFVSDFNGGKKLNEKRNTTKKRFQTFLCTFCPRTLNGPDCTNVFIYRNHKSYWQRSLCADSLQKLLYFGSGLVNKLTVGSTIYLLLSCSSFWSMTKCRSEETMGRIPDTDCKSPIHWPRRLEQNNNPGTEIQGSFQNVYFSKFKASAGAQDL